MSSVGVTVFWYITINTCLPISTWRNNLRLSLNRRMGHDAIKGYVRWKYLTQSFRQRQNFFLKIKCNRLYLGPVLPPASQWQLKSALHVFERCFFFDKSKVIISYCLVPHYEKRISFNTIQGMNYWKKNQNMTKFVFIHFWNFTYKKGIPKNTNFEQNVRFDWLWRQYFLQQVLCLILLIVGNFVFSLHLVGWFRHGFLTLNILKLIKNIQRQTDRKSHSSKISFLFIERKIELNFNKASEICVSNRLEMSILQQLSISISLPHPRNQCKSSKGFGNEYFCNKFSLVCYKIGECVMMHN